MTITVRDMIMARGMTITVRDNLMAKGHDNHSTGPIMARDMKITARDMTITARGPSWQGT